MVIVIDLISVSIVLFLSLRFSIKDKRRNFNAMDENIESIENRIAQ